jgi:histone deacetylase 1/2
VENQFQNVPFKCNLQRYNEAPPDSMIPEFDEDDLNADERYGGQLGRDRIVHRDDEYYDSDRDQDHD